MMTRISSNQHFY